MKSQRMAKLAAILLVAGAQGSNTERGNYMGQAADGGGSYTSLDPHFFDDFGSRVRALDSGFRGEGAGSGGEGEE